MIAENEFVLTEELFYEGFAGVQGDYRKFIRGLIAVLAVLGAGLIAFTLIRGESFLFVVVELAVLLFVGVYAGVFLPKRKAKAAYEAILRRTGANAPRVTRFYEDHLEADAGGQTATLSYRDILRQQETARLHILVGSDKRGFMIKKDGFTQGTLAQVLTAIEKANTEEEDHD